MYFYFFDLTKISLLDISNFILITYFNFINHSSKLTHYNQIYYKIRIIGIE
ncbi:MAG: hypothetical protein Q8830_00670 [Candidatus Phytoplasma australasiaticum]|nr:hypothetical protein [Candidatus Phytoplasma australasiaticum]